MTLDCERGSVLIGMADAHLAQRFLAALQRCVKPGSVFIATSLGDLFEQMKCRAWSVIAVSNDLAENLPLTEILRQILGVSPIILIAPQERQTEIAVLVAEGNVDFVAQVGDFLTLAASLVECRTRREQESEMGVRYPPEVSHQVAEIFRHEINNPLTGILGNAELVLAHENRMSVTDIQRLRTIVDLAVRLRETIRRLTHMLQAQPHPLKS
jgi:nitrogen-specific signal transduction histidine kinase